MLPNANLKYFRTTYITLPYEVEKHMHEYWELASDMPIAEIAQNCGFYSPAYFSAIFRQETGVTPTQYRDTCRHIADWNDMIVYDTTAEGGLTRRR